MFHLRELLFGKRPNRHSRRNVLGSPMAAFFFFGLFLAVSVLITGCSSKMVLEDVVLPYTTVKSVMNSTLPGGIRVQSMNGREMTSQYFALGKYDTFRPLVGDEIDTAHERGYAEVVVLGERRPYQIEIKAFRQKKDPGAKRFSSPSYDKDLTEAFTKKLKDALANRREERNIIDGFRAF